LYKHGKWQKKQLLEQLALVEPILKKHMTLYSIKKDIDFIDLIRPNITHITNTINTFMFYRYNKDLLEFLNNMKPFFEKIRHKDKVMFFDGKNQLFHTYKLLHFIYTYFVAIAKYESGKYKSKTIAHLNGVQSEFLVNAKYHRKHAFRNDTILKKISIMDSFIYRKYFYYKDAANHFINNFTLIPPHQIKDLQDGSIVAIFINKMITNFGTTNIKSTSTILKSLAIVMAHYMTEKMNITKQETIYLLKEFFNYYINDDEDYFNIPNTFNELAKNYYIKHRMDLVPIFGSSKSPQESLEKFSDLNWIYDDFEKEFNISFPDGMINDFNPAKMSISIYLNQAPMELLQETQ